MKQRVAPAHRFKDYGRKNITGAVFIGRTCQSKDVAVLQFGEYVLLRKGSTKLDPFPEPVMGNRRLELLAQRTIANDLAMKSKVALIQLCASFDQDVEPLEGNQAPYA